MKWLMAPTIIISFCLGAITVMLGIRFYHIYQDWRYPPITYRARPTSQGLFAAEPVAERLNKLLRNLTTSSREVDLALREIERVMRDRQFRVSELETKSKSLEEQEKQLRIRIQSLQLTPLPAAEHFAALVASQDKKRTDHLTTLMATGEKRSAARDYLLFGTGVLVSIAISIVLQLVF